MSSLGLLPDFILRSSPIVQGVWGTLFTWFVTALGSAVVFLIPENLSAEREGVVLDGSLGFAGGVMLAASYWSLLAPAIALAEEGSGFRKEYSFVPAAVGFFLGALFVWLSDVLLPEGADSFEQLHTNGKTPDHDRATPHSERDTERILVPSYNGSYNGYNNNNLRQRRGKILEKDTGDEETMCGLGRKSDPVPTAQDRRKSRRRLQLLVVAVTLHNFPEGLAVGVGFGAAGTTPAATLQAAELLAFGIGIQNFPEGLAVALPLRRLGYSRAWCFFCGQLSGAVEPLGGYLGAAAVSYAEPLLPYALAFAAGAMVYVVVDSIIPEAQTRGNSKISSWGTILGFLVMMCLDVGLG